MARFRGMKRQVREILAAPDWEARLAELDEIPARQLSGPLFSFLLDREELVVWHAVTAFGLLAARMAGERMEDARVLMRQFMWRMNEESGNLGWGIPESMAEAMAAHPGLSEEYHTILASYVYCDERCDGNYLDHEELRRGVYWGLGRLAQVRPEAVAHAMRFLASALERESDARNRGYAAWALGLLGRDAAGALSALERLAGSDAGREELPIYRDRALACITVGALAGEARNAVAAAVESAEV